MPADFLANVETAFLAVFNADPILDQYHWQRWDSDVQLELPRGVLGLRSRRDPEESPYRRIEIAVRLEGLPEKQQLSSVMATLVNLMEHTTPEDLSIASGNTVAFIGRAVNVTEDRPITEGKRTWTLGFVVYAVPS